MEALHRHFILIKPYKYLSQFTYDFKKKNKRLLGELGEFPEGTMAIGRLDEKSEGLLLLTTDGKVSEYVRSSKIEKEYYVQVDGTIPQEKIEELKNGVDIAVEGKLYRTLKCEAKILNPVPEFGERPGRRVRDDRHGPSTWISIVLKEGKFRQVRKMTAVIGFPTLRLIRVRIGEIKMGSLTPGRVEEVSKFEA